MAIYIIIRTPLTTGAADHCATIIMQDYAVTFYKSKAWKDTRRAYAKAASGLCEVCLAKGIYKPGEIVHHKIHINPDNITDPSVTLSWDNLQVVCRDCHAEIHATHARRYRVDDLGRVLTDSPRC